MADIPSKKMTPDSYPEQYEIRVQEILDTGWAEWLGYTEMVHTTTETILAFSVQDQTELHGLLAKIRDLNLKLISVTRIEFEASQDKPDPNGGPE